MLLKFRQAWRSIAQKESRTGTTTSNVQFSFRDVGTVMFFSLAAFMLSIYAAESRSANHVIVLQSDEVNNDGFGNMQLAYRLTEYTIDDQDISSRYSTEATIPGPTFFFTEGDKVKISILNAIPGNETPVHAISKQVSIHVHGVHYKITSDGTLTVINKVDDQGAGAGLEQTYVRYDYEWDVAPGTAGTWPYHDHNYLTHNGSEHMGLYGALVVNKPNAPKFDKEYILYMHDDAFWGTEIEGATYKELKHGPNPTFTAAKGNNVRFHVLAMGSDIHRFAMPKYEWNDPGTTNKVHQAHIGPLEKHVFTVVADRSTYFIDLDLTNRLMGMLGKFEVN